MSVDLETPRPAPATAKPNNWPGGVGLAIAMIVAFLWAAGQSLASIGRNAAETSSAPGDPTTAWAESLGSATGSIIGVTLIVTAVVGGVLYFAVVKNAKANVGPKYFALVALAAIAGVAPLQTLYLIGTDGRVARDRTDALVSTYQDNLDADERAYARELGETGFNERFATKRAIAGNLDDSEAVTARAAAVVQKFDALRNQRAQAMRADLAAAVTSPAARTRLLAGFDEGRAEAKVQQDRRWALEARAIDNTRELVRTLKQSRGRWTVSGQNVVFSRQSDLDAFNRALATLKATNAEQRAALTEMNADIERERRAADGNSGRPGLPAPK